jgi:hypothetical protein
MQPSELPLRDIHLPIPVSHFPPALGWWLLLIGFPLLTGLGYWLYRRLTRSTPVKTARKLLAALKNSPKSEQQKIVELSVLIRRVAISVAPRENCASLIGQAWLNYLDKSLKNNEFTQGVGRCLAQVNYQQKPSVAIDMNELFNLTERWLKAQK